jgi:Dolichyl-phosphate-mannose-protein mannosyltransferase
MAAAPRRSPASGTALLLAGLVVVGLALRLSSFDDSLFGDDLSTNYVVNGFGVGNIFDILASDQEGTPPLFFLLTSLTKGFGDTEGLRLVSLLAGLACIPLTYLLGERTVGRPAGLVAAALVALSPFQIFYATEARAYALMMLFCLLATLALLIAIESGRTRWWLAYALAVAAAAYTHYPSVFVLMVLFGWAFVARPQVRKQLLLANVGAALLFAPWIPEFIRDGDAPAAQVLEIFHPLTLSSAASDVVRWALGHPTIPTEAMPGTLALWLIGAGALVGGIGLVARLRADHWEGTWPPPSPIVLLVLLIVAPPIGAVLHNLIAPSVFFPRNLIGSWPALAVLTGAVLTAGAAPLRYAAIGLLLGGVSIGAVKMLDADNQRPDYEAAVDFIERNGDPGSPVVDLPQATPGPQSALEAAIAPGGEAAPPDREVLTLGYPTLETRLSTRLEDLPVLDPLLIERGVPSEEEIARRAAQIAGSGKIFLVTWGGANSIEQERAAQGSVDSFLAALPPRFHEVDSRSFDGNGVLAPSVYVLSGSAAGS